MLEATVYKCAPLALTALQGDLLKQAVPVPTGDMAAPLLLYSWYPSILVLCVSQACVLSTKHIFSEASEMHEQGNQWLKCYLLTER